MKKIRSRPDAQEQPGAAARIAATALLAGVLDRKHPLDALIDTGTGEPAYVRLPERDRRLARAIVGTALRRHGEIAALLSRLIEKRPPRARNLFHTLHAGVAQIIWMEVADHAAVSIAIDQVNADPGIRHLSGLANAVLRRVARERNIIRVEPDAPHRNMPDWLWRRWSAAYGDDEARRIAEAHLSEPPLDISVKGDATGWAERLGGTRLPTGSVRITAGSAIDALPGYTDGEWWVQDAAAALPAKLLADVAGKRVADLCAAPGGKTAQLAVAGANVTAVDISARRLERGAVNLARLNLAADLVAADVLTWQPADRFDAVLLDAPCSATGTIRRHPDVAWLKQEEDIPALAKLQSRLIGRAAAMLRPGGLLVYCTCSLEPEEGERHVGDLARHGLILDPVTPAEIGGLTESVTPEGTVRTLPFHASGLDGFFIMRARKA
jgi:16S rRNA (cytosine967-C5)-methyltransferase